MSNLLTRASGTAQDVIQGAARGSWGKGLEALSIGSVAIPFLVKDKNTKAMEDIVSRQEKLAEQKQNPLGRAYDFANRVERPGAIVER